MADSRGDSCLCSPVGSPRTTKTIETYDHHADIYRPDIQRSQLLSKGRDEFTVYYRLYKKAIVTAVYNANFDVRYFSVDPRREHARCYSTRIAEVEHPGEPAEHEMPVGYDRGFLWRLYTYSRYEEKDDGVYIQVELIALSRNIPAIFAWFVNPVVARIELFFGNGIGH